MTLVLHLLRMLLLAWPLLCAKLQIKETSVKKELQEELVVCKLSFFKKVAEAFVINLFCKEGQPTYPAAYLLGSFPGTLPPACSSAFIAVTQVQDTALDLVEPHTIGLSPVIQPAQITLQSLPTLQQIHTPAQHGVTCKTTEGTLSFLLQVVDKDIKQD